MISIPKPKFIIGGKPSNPRKPTEAEKALTFIQQSIKDRDRGADLKYNEWVGIDAAFSVVGSEIRPDSTPDDGKPDLGSHPFDRVPVTSPGEGVGGSLATPETSDA